MFVTARQDYKHIPFASFAGAIALFTSERDILLATRTRTKQKAATWRDVTADCEKRLLIWLGSLLIVGDHLRRYFAHFKLVAHLLNLRCLSFEG